MTNATSLKFALHNIFTQNTTSLFELGIALMGFEHERRTEIHENEPYWVPYYLPTCSTYDRTELVLTKT